MRQIYTIREGKIASLREYFTKAEALEAAARADRSSGVILGAAALREEQETGPA